ncbi:hypothetical protein GJ496_000699 [Pomphorhynchus laevis]|nr:hypothetical protein GJ496_000699 [Pomphorhynchus laevis]
MMYLKPDLHAILSFDKSCKIIDFAKWIAWKQVKNWVIQPNVSVPVVFTENSGSHSILKNYCLSNFENPAACAKYSSD